MDNNTTGTLQSVFNNLRYVLTPAPIEPYPASPPDIELPDDWANLQQNYRHNGLEKIANIFFSPAETDTPKGDIFYSLGWKTHPLEKLKVIQDLQAEGYNVIAMPLAESNSTIGTMAENITRMREVLFNEDSVLHQLRQKERPLFVLTHSTSTTVYETALQSAKADNLFQPDIELTVHTNPFINARGASRSEDPLLSRFYRWHASHHMNDHAGTPFLDRVFYVASGLGDRLRNEDPRERPTHGQILEISEYGDKLLESYSFGEASDPPVIAFISSNDDFASPAVAERYFGDKHNVKDLHTVKAGHNVLLDDDLRFDIMNIMNHHAEHYTATHLPAAPPLSYINPHQDEGLQEIVPAG